MSKTLELDVPRVDGMTIAFAGPAELKLTGTIAMKDPREALGRFLRKVHEAVLADGEKDVVVDVAELKFVNSSAIRLFVDWAMWLKDGSTPYKLRFKSDRSIAWQRTTFAALLSLAKNTLSVELVSA